MRPWQTLAAHLAQAPAVLVRVDEVQGSAPREVGAWMAVTATELIGTIGGGQLEFEAQAKARAALAAGGGVDVRQRVALGPSLGQCCGGVVWLCFEWLDASAIDTLAERLGAQSNWRPIALFGGGHVGRAMVELLGRLPVQVHWIDSRDGVFPAPMPDNVRSEHSEPVQGAVSSLAAGARVLIMSFSHAEDLDILAACLKRQREHGDLPFIGLIGSKSKWATFQHRLEARGFSAQELAQVTCPIGIPGISGKQPEVVALAAVAQLMLG
ncbi:xanthine dehydrogenase accessory protein XdhC [Roseateles amylovorans]|uniref:Xanthine dehydrogenase accessory protein XdhC n=1 Tax=Roseateles amylovorans TaxID=2978473 RepID=A0ABY6AYA8_9BURK|nr:xanthine dehydrogenase accessory protein XdhC [Roseateles amylovorans]UXH77278.1 xanthine dehydrogenase accessory protein XdhC [Roseateles amylovorans]